MTAKATVRQAVQLGAGPALERIRSRTTEALEPFRLDPLLFIRRLKVWDPDARAFVNFEPWEHQASLLGEWMDLERLRVTGDLIFRNTIVEKSRQMGDTVILAAACLWIITHHDAPLLMQHQDIQEVADSGPTWDSFFGKIKAMHDSQPWEIGKAALKFIGGNNPIIRNEANPIRFITGEGQTPDPGRGGRYAAAVLDEAARLRYDTAGQAALARAVPEGRLMLSTPKGRGNVYFRLREERPEGWRIVEHHWSLNPVYRQGIHYAAFAPDRDSPGGYAPQPDKEMRRASLRCKLCAGTVAGKAWTAAEPRAHRFPGRLTSDWYEKAHAEMTREQVAEELDIDYTASLTGRVYEEFDERVHVVDRIAYDRHLPLEFSFDYGWDVTHVGIWQDAPMELRKIGEVEATEALPEDVADDVRATLRALGVAENELLPEITRQMLSVGDPAGEGTQLNTGEALVVDYWRAGFVIGNPGHQRVATTIKALKRLLDGRPKPVRYSRAGCPLTILHMQQNRWPTDPQGQRRVGAAKPLDDVHNHACRADAYYVTYKYPPPADAMPQAEGYERGGLAESLADEYGGGALGFEMDL
jgi:hypothetical protein